MEEINNTQQNNNTPAQQVPKLLTEQGFAYLVQKMQQYVDNKITQAGDGLLTSGSYWKDIVDSVNRLFGTQYTYTDNPEDVMQTLVSSTPADTTKYASLKGVELDPFLAGKGVLNILAQKNNYLKKIDDDKGEIYSIGNATFHSCSALQSVNLPAVTSIGSDAFNSCSALQSVNLPAVTSILGYAFASCSALQSVNLPLVTSIAANAFYSCSALQSVNLPAVTSIGDYAFRSCSALQSVNLPLVTSIAANAFYSCSALQSVNLPAVTSILGYVFYSCSALQSVNLPAVTSIAANAFNSCSALQSVNLAANHGNVFSTSTFLANGCVSLYRLHLVGVRTNSANYSATWNPTLAVDVNSTSLVQQRPWDLDENGEPIDCSQFTSNRDKFLWCFRHLFMPAFSYTAATLTLKSTVYDVITQEQDIVDFFANRGWTLARVA